MPPVSPVLQEDSLPAESSGKPILQVINVRGKNQERKAAGSKVANRPGFLRDTPVVHPAGGRSPMKAEILSVHLCTSCSWCSSRHMPGVVPDTCLVSVGFC